MLFRVLAQVKVIAAQPRLVVVRQGRLLSGQVSCCQRRLDECRPGLMAWWEVGCCQEEAVNLEGDAA